HAYPPPSNRVGSSGPQATPRVVPRGLALPCRSWYSPIFRLGSRYYLPLPAGELPTLPLDRQGRDIAYPRCECLQGPARSFLWIAIRGQERRRLPGGQRYIELVQR